MLLLHGLGAVSWSLALSLEESFRACNGLLFMVVVTAGP